ncbi:MAG: GHKL domain-containing protein [Deltaproteobacteria bacterium]|nr:GHKL domain-containing protein [Deltaproteobacteria bacterium]
MKKEILSLNLRQKIITGISLFSVAVAIVGLLSFRNLKVIERKIRFVEIADDLQNIVLEIRRYEKNFFLYGFSEAGALAENKRYIGRALSILRKFSPELTGLEGAPKIGLLRKELIEYGELIDRIRKAAVTRELSSMETLQGQLRQKGKALVDLSRELVKFERERIILILERLYGHLFAAMVLFFFFWGFLAKDETERVIRAFNRMVTELEKRQNQLVQAKKLSSLGTLTSGIAHELNNPLNNISTSCQIALEEIDEIDREFLRKMLMNTEKEIARARDIVKGLLEFSRTKEFSLEPSSVKAVVKKAYQLVASQLPGGIEIHIDIPDDLIIPLDTQRMQQVFLNLFLNAIQAIPAPPGEIRVVARTDPDKNEAIIEVEDTGVGIDAEHLSRIFDPFFTTKDVGGGTGLGLSIVHGIIEQHSGNISVESKKGEGTRFTIRLPMKVSD